MTINKWKVPYVDLSREYDFLIKEGLLEIIERVLKSGRFVLGPELEKFESEMAEYLGVKYTIGVNSGADAIFLSLRALGVGPGHEVITTSHTHISTIAAIQHLGATPILVDIDEDYNINPLEVKRELNDSTSVILPVSLNGHICSLEYLAGLSKSQIVEDSCQSLGASYNGTLSGTTGIGCFSFHPLKVLSGIGDGGLVSTNNRSIANKIRLLRNHGTKDRVNYELWGYNSRLDEVNAAVLSFKLKYLKDWINKRRDYATLYRKGLGFLDKINLPQLYTGYFDTYSSYVIRVKDRDSLVKYLVDKDIETQVSWSKPIHKQFLMFSNYKLPVTERVSNEVLSLPIHPFLTKSQIEYVIESIRLYYEGGFSE